MQGGADAGRSSTFEDHSFMLGLGGGVAVEAQGQDIVGGPILASLFVYAF